MDLNRLPVNGINRFINGLMRNSGPGNPVWNVEHFNNHTENRWNYVDGCMMLAFLELYKVSGEEKYFKFAYRFMNSFVQEDGAIRTYGAQDYCLDNINAAKALFPLWERTGEEKYRGAIIHVYENLIQMPRTKSGNFWHKKIYPNQVWLDGLYMSMPFYTQYETKFHGMRNYYDIYSQFMNVRKYMRDPKTGLYYHGYDESRCALWADRETGCSQSFWLRSMGWLAMALVDTLEQMDEQLYYEYRQLCTMLKDLVDALLPYQHENGMFYQVVNRPDDSKNYLETSGTCMVAYGILKAVRLGLVPARYVNFAETAFCGTVNRCFSAEKEKQPVLGGICLVAGLGGPQNRDGSPSYYYSEPVTENEGKGIAPFLLAYAEVLRQNPNSRAETVEQFAPGNIEGNRYD